MLLYDVWLMAVVMWFLGTGYGTRKDSLFWFYFPICLGFIFDHLLEGSVHSITVPIPLWSNLFSCPQEVYKQKICNFSPFSLFVGMPSHNFCCFFPFHFIDLFRACCYYQLSLFIRHNWLTFYLFGIFFVCDSAHNVL
jgi:hypothetical protein